MDKGAPLDAMNAGDARPLHAAACCGNAAAADLLLKSGAGVDPTDRMLYTPLHYAAANGHVEVTKVRGGS